MTTGDGSFIGGGVGSGAGGSRARSTRAPRRDSLAARLAAAGVGAREEARSQVERWTLWTPVAYGVGCAGYMGLRQEPSAWLLAAGAIGGVAAVWAARVWGRSRAAVILLTLLAFGAGGLSVAKLRTWTVASPVLAGPGRVATVEGWVVDVIGRGAAGPRVVLAPARVSGLEPNETPARLRVTLPDDVGILGPGSAVRLTALINPPPSPASPGAYDFARDAFFQRVGGSGVALKAPETIRLHQPSDGLQAAMTLNAARWSLSRRIVAIMGERTGGIAASMVTGHEAWLDPVDVQALRDSGLAHVLSISGLHMAVVGGFVFALVRLLVSLWPWLALRVSGKKIAAASGLVAVLAYLLISGRPPPAERSAVTAGVAFLAILLDRRALSLHSLAVAALVVLSLQPEAVAQPGFQMSFCATAALLALAEAWPREGQPRSLPWQIRAVQRARGWLVAAVAASLVAGLATEPFAIQHFNRITLYGLFTNLITEPITSLLMMPALAIGAVATMFGVGEAPLAVAGWGVQAMTGVAHAFAAGPNAVVIIASASDWALPASFLGILFVCLWQGRLRWLGLPLAAAVLIAPKPERPVAWVAADGAAAAVQVGRQAQPLRPGAQTFATELWARRRGLTLPKDAEAGLASRYDCNRDRCVPTATASLAIAGWWRRKPPSTEALQALCSPPVRIVVLRRGEGDDPTCRDKLVLGEAALRSGGAAEIYARPGGWHVVWSAPIRGERPWVARPRERVSGSGG